MLKIGIVGSDNSHAIAYSKLTNIDRIVGDRAQVVGLWGAEPERTKEVSEKGQIPLIVEKPEDLIGKVDAILVVDRHGDLHLPHALPFLEAGIPVYVDKPLTISLGDAVQLFETSRTNNALMTSYSSLRYAAAIDDLASSLEGLGQIHAGHMTGPCDFGSEYGGPFFYATHVLEMALRLLGDEVATVRAVRSGSTVVVTLTWANGPVLTISYLAGAAYHFHVTLFGAKGMVAEEVLGGDATYAAGLKAFLAAVESGQAPLTFEQMLRPIAIVHAIQHSLDRDGVAVEVQPLVDEALA